MASELNLQNTTLLTSVGDPRQFPALSAPQIALSGRSNVGKSSLINTLLGRKSLARVSGSPGKTVTVNFYEVDRRLLLVDLPGYGFARRCAKDKEAWSRVTDAYFTKNKNIDRLRLVLQLIDLKVGPTEDDRTMLRFLRETGLPFAVVATKADKPNKTERAAALARLCACPDLPSGTPVIVFSSVTGEGKAEVWREIAAAAQF